MNKIDKTFYTVWAADDYGNKLILARGPKWWIISEVEAAVPRYKQFTIDIDRDQKNNELLP